MNVRGRLRKLEQRTRTRLLPPIAELLDEELVQCFTAWEKEGAFAAEPDFPIALAAVREALAAAQCGDAPFDPPATFRPDLAARQRIKAWRSRHSFPELNAAWQWLSEIYERVITGIPPVTEAEFHELADWFAANDHRLAEAALPSQMLDVGDGRATSSANLRYGLSRGPRAVGAGRLAEDVRRLRARQGSR